MKPSEKNHKVLVKRISLYGFFVLLALGIIFLLSSSFVTKEHRKAGVKHENTMKLPEITLAIEVANTKEELEMGLSGRTSIGEKEGMLFIFPKMGQYQFWMKDMLFPLDIVWISDEGRVVSITENALPESYPKKIFKNDAFAKYVLEMKAGTSRKYGLYLGTSVGLPSGLTE